MKGMIIDGFSFVDLQKVISTAPFDKIFYIGEGKSLEKIKGVPNVVAYNCFDLPLGKYPDDFLLTEPLDEKTINRFLDCESLVMKMFERNDFWFQASFNQRKEWYFMHLRYWYHMIHKYNVMLFMKSNFAHEVYDYVIYSIVKEKNAKSFFFTQLSFMNRFVLENDVFAWSRLKTYMDSTNSNREMTDELKNYLKKQRAPAEKTKDVFQIMEEQRGVIKNQHKIIKIYNKKYAVVPNLEEKYFFVALHMQPEMTTSPMAGQYVYQDLIVELLDFYLPRNIYIYIKEHPAQTTIGRSLGFYEKFFNRDRIKFVKTTVNSRVLLDSSLAVVTCTGSVGWEALIRCKPVLLFGNNFYQLAPACFSIKSKDDLVSAVDKILSSGKPSEEEMDLFFSKVYDYSYYGYVDTAFKDIIGISESSNSEKIMKIINNEIYSHFNS